MVTVQSTKIGAERRGYDPSFVLQFLVRFGEKAGRLSTAEFGALSCEFKTAISCECTAMLRIGDRPTAY